MMAFIEPNFVTHDIESILKCNIIFCPRLISIDNVCRAGMARVLIKTEMPLILNTTWYQTFSWARDDTK